MFFCVSNILGATNKYSQTFFAINDLNIISPSERKFLRATGNINCF